MVEARRIGQLCLQGGSSHSRCKCLGQGAKLVSTQSMLAICLPPGARELSCLFQLLNELSSDHAAAKEELDALQDAATSQNSQKSSD